MKKTVARLLNEYKLLKKRIDKKTHNACFITYAVNEKVQNDDCHPKEDFQSISDMIIERQKIKSAIIASNASTLVKINDETMTVAEAIEKKESMQFLKNLLSRMQDQHRNIIRHIEQENEEAQDRLTRLLEANFGGRESKVRDTEIESVTDTFWKSNLAEKVDPISLADEIEKLDEYIDSFESEVDLVLSESNARTEVEID
jgi:flagellar motor component MotA